MIKGFLLGLGLVAAVMLILSPEIKRQQPRRFVPESDSHRFERQARIAQDVTAPEGNEPEERPQRRQASDEEISARKDYRPPDAWKWKYEPFAPRNIECDWIDDWGMEVCHTRFEEPIGRYYREPPLPRRQRRDQPRFVRYGPPVQVRVPCRGGCPYP